jgi:uncharacterized protein (TIGR04255 family)
MSRKYKNPPLIEAICEFRFQPSTSWDNSFPAQVQAQLQKKFPKQREETVIQSSLTNAPQEKQVNYQLKSNAVSRLLAEDERASVLIDIDRIAISHLKPYPQWDAFLLLIQEVLAAYCAVANPKGLHRVGLRYINVIEIPSKELRLVEYLKFLPLLEWPTPLAVESFLVGLQILYAEKRDILTMQLSNGAAEKPDTAAIVLDLDYGLGQSGGVALNLVGDWLNDAHLRIEEAFENCIKDSLRLLFDEEK